MRAMALAAAICIAGCASAGSKKRASPSLDGDCAAGCESNIWPRVMIALVPPEGFVGDPTRLAKVRGRFAGGEQQATSHGCPADLPATLKCTYGLFASPTDGSFELVVEPAVGETQRKTIALSPFNTCGRSIAYLSVRFDSGSIELSDVRYVNPCATP